MYHNGTETWEGMDREDTQARGMKSDLNIWILSGLDSHIKVH